MAFIRKRRPWDSQPQEAVRSNESIAGLRRLILPHIGPFDLAEGAQVDFSLVGGSVPSPTGIGALGSGLYLNDSLNNTEISLPSWTNTTNEASALLVFQRDSNTYDGTPWEMGAAAGDHFPYSGLIYTDAFWTGRWANGVSPPAGFRFDAPTAILLSVKNGEQRIFVNGRLIYSSTSTGGFSLPATLTPFRRTLRGMAHMAALFDRAVTANEGFRYSANPWQLFAPRVILVPVSAGGGTTITATLGTATASGHQATVNANRTIAASLGTATASGFQATVQNSTDTTISATLGTATASGFAANVDANRTIAAGLGTATASGHQATVSNTNDTVINAGVGTATASGYAANLNINRTIAAGLGTAQALGYAATVSNGDLQAGGQAGFVMRRMRRLIKLRFNGKLYQAFEEDIPELLETLEEQAEQKVKKKRNARSKPAPVATVVSAPDDVLPDLKARIAEVNHSIGVLWGVEDDEDEELLWLML